MKLSNCCKQPVRHWWHKPTTDSLKNGAGKITTYKHNYTCSSCGNVCSAHKKEIISGFSSSIVFDMLGKMEFDRFVKEYLNQKEKRKSKFKEHKTQNNYSKMI